MSSLQSWVKEHKLASIGAFWASAVGASVLYNRRKSPMKTSLQVIHARVHAQALTLAVLGGAALFHYYNGRKARDDDYEFYSQLPAATTENGEETERWSW